MMLVVLFIAIIVSDQVTKSWVLSAFSLGSLQPVIPGFFDLTLVLNPGAAFGMFSGMPDTQRRIVLASVSLIALLVIGRLLLEDAKRDSVARVALIVVLAGAIGNMIDRLRFDAVVDFFLLYYRDYHFPAFNIADSAISVGVTLLVWRIVFPPKELVKQGAMPVEGFPSAPKAE